MNHEHQQLQQERQQHREPVHITQEPQHTTLTEQQMQQQRISAEIQRATQAGELPSPLARHLDRQAAVQRTAPAPQAEEPELSRKERSRQEKELAKGHKRDYQGLQALAKSNQPFTQAQLEQIRQLRETRWGQEEWLSGRTKERTQQELYRMAQDGDYSAFEDLDVVLRNELAMRHIAANPPEHYLSEEGRAELEANPGIAMHPLLRLGISIRMRREPELMRQLDTLMGSTVMLATLTKETTAQEVQRDNPQYTPREAQAEAERNLAAQIFIAKNLLLAHMSNLSRIDENRETHERVASPWDTDVSALYTHCSRVSYIMPEMRKEQAHEEMWGALRGLVVQRDSRIDKLGGKTGNLANLFSRGASTHDFQRRKVIGGSFKEKKVLFNLSGQEGMNIAIGGLGTRGIAGPGGVQRPIRNDGSCGHIYTMMRKGDKNYNGGYLIGFESDAHTMTNQLGHRHGLGNGEYASSFGGQRVDEIGAKYGGRVADLSGWSEEAIRDNLMALENYMRGVADTKEAMRKLVGPKMNPEQLGAFLRQIRSLGVFS